jgi:G3E family GTPase
MVDRDEILPLSILTGFLGSGKTTFLRRALSAAAFADTAVLVNELGEIALDHYLVETADAPVLELPGGCLCCAIREDLAATLRDLLGRRDEGRVAPFRRIVIETTGLADPAPILFTLGADPTLDRRTRLDRVVATIDATTGAATLARFAEAARQVAVADRLLVTKTDLAPFAPSLASLLETLNAGAERLDAREAQDPGATLFGGAEAAIPRPAPADVAAEHAEGVASHAIVLGGTFTRLDFARGLGGFVRDRGHDLLRVKGVVQFSDRPATPAFVQGAQHALYPPVWLPEWPDEDRRSRLVFITDGVSRDEILGRFAFAGAAPWTKLRADAGRRAAPAHAH